MFKKVIGSLRWILLKLPVIFILQLFLFTNVNLHDVFALAPNLMSSRDEGCAAFQMCALGRQFRSRTNLEIESNRKIGEDLLDDYKNDQEILLDRRAKAEKLRDSTARSQALQHDDAGIDQNLAWLVGVSSVTGLEKDQARRVLSSLTINRSQTETGQIQYAYGDMPFFEVTNVRGDHFVMVVNRPEVAGEETAYQGFSQVHLKAQQDGRDFRMMNRADKGNFLFIKLKDGESARDAVVNEVHDTRQSLGQVREISGHLASSMYEAMAQGAIAKAFLDVQEDFELSKRREHEASEREHEQAGILAESWAQSNVREAISKMSLVGLDVNENASSQLLNTQRQQLERADIVDEVQKSLDKEFNEADKAFKAIIKDSEGNPLNYLSIKSEIELLGCKVSGDSDWNDGTKPIIEVDEEVFTNHVNSMTIELTRHNHNVDLLLQKGEWLEAELAEIKDEKESIKINRAVYVGKLVTFLEKQIEAHPALLIQLANEAGYDARVMDETLRSGQIENLLHSDVPLFQIILGLANQENEPSMTRNLQNLLALNGRLKKLEDKESEYIQEQQEINDNAWVSVQSLQAYFEKSFVQNFLKAVLNDEEALSLDLLMKIKNKQDIKANVSILREFYTKMTSLEALDIAVLEKRLERNLDNEWKMKLENAWELLMAAPLSEQGAYFVARKVEEDFVRKARLSMQGALQVENARQAYDQVLKTNITQLTEIVEELKSNSKVSYRRAQVAALQIDMMHLIESTIKNDLMSFDPRTIESLFDSMGQIMEDSARQSGLFTESIGKALVEGVKSLLQTSYGVGVLIRPTGTGTTLGGALDNLILNSGVSSNPRTRVLDRIKPTHVRRLLNDSAKWQLRARAMQFVDTVFNELQKGPVDASTMDLYARSLLPLFQFYNEEMANEQKGLVPHPVFAGRGPGSFRGKLEAIMKPTDNGMMQRVGVQTTQAAQQEMGQLKTETQRLIQNIVNQTRLNLQRAGNDKVSLELNDDYSVSFSLKELDGKKITLSRQQMQALIAGESVREEAVIFDSTDRGNSLVIGYIVTDAGQVQQNRQQGGITQPVVPLSKSEIETKVLGRVRDAEKTALQQRLSREGSSIAVRKAIELSRDENLLIADSEDKDKRSDKDLAEAMLVKEMSRGESIVRFFGTIVLLSVTMMSVVIVIALAMGNLQVLLFGAFIVITIALIAMIISRTVDAIKGKGKRPRFLERMIYPVNQSEKGKNVRRVFWISMLILGAGLLVATLVIFSINGVAFFDLGSTVLTAEQLVLPIIGGMVGASFLFGLIGSIVTFKGIGEGGTKKAAERLREERERASDGFVPKEDENLTKAREISADVKNNLRRMVFALKQAKLSDRQIEKALKNVEQEHLVGWNENVEAQDREDLEVGGVLGVLQGVLKKGAKDDVKAKIDKAIDEILKPILAVLDRTATKDILDAVNQDLNLNVEISEIERQVGAEDATRVRDATTKLGQAQQEGEDSDDIATTADVQREVSVKLVDVLKFYRQLEEQADVITNAAELKENDIQAQGQVGQSVLGQQPGVTFPLQGMGFQNQQRLGGMSGALKSPLSQSTPSKQGEFGEDFDQLLQAQSLENAESGKGESQILPPLTAPDELLLNEGTRRVNSNNSFPYMEQTRQYHENSLSGFKEKIEGDILKLPPAQQAEYQGRLADVQNIGPRRSPPFRGGDKHEDTLVEVINDLEQELSTSQSSYLDSSFESDVSSKELLRSQNNFERTVEAGEARRQTLIKDYVDTMETYQKRLNLADKPSTFAEISVLASKKNNLSLLLDISQARKSLFQRARDIDFNLERHLQKREQDSGFLVESSNLMSHQVDPLDSQSNAFSESLQFLDGDFLENLHSSNERVQSLFDDVISFDRNLRVMASFQELEREERIVNKIKTRLFSLKSEMEKASVEKIEKWISYQLETIAALRQGKEDQVKNIQGLKDITGNTRIPDDLLEALLPRRQSLQQDEIGIKPLVPSVRKALLLEVPQQTDDVRVVMNRDRLKVQLQNKFDINAVDIETFLTHLEGLKVLKAQADGNVEFKASVLRKEKADLLLPRGVSLRNVQEAFVQVADDLRIDGTGVANQQELSLQVTGRPNTIIRGVIGVLAVGLIAGGVGLLFVSSLSGIGLALITIGVVALLTTTVVRDRQRVTNKTAWAYGLVGGGLALATLILAIVGLMIGMAVPVIVLAVTTAVVVSMIFVTQLVHRAFVPRQEVRVNVLKESRTMKAIRIIAGVLAFATIVGLVVFFGIATGTNALIVLGIPFLLLLWTMAVYRFGTKDYQREAFRNRGFFPTLFHNISSTFLGQVITLVLLIGLGAGLFFGLSGFMMAANLGGFLLVAGVALLVIVLLYHLGKTIFGRSDFLYKKTSTSESNQDLTVIHLKSQSGKQSGLNVAPIIPGIGEAKGPEYIYRLAKTPNGEESYVRVKVGRFKRQIVDSSDARGLFGTKRQANGYKFEAKQVPGDKIEGYNGQADNRILVMTEEGTKLRTSRAGGYIIAAIILLTILAIAIAVLAVELGGTFEAIGTFIANIATAGFALPTVTAVGTAGGGTGAVIATFFTTTLPNAVLWLFLAGEEISRLAVILAGVGILVMVGLATVRFYLNNHVNERKYDPKILPEGQKMTREQTITEANIYLKNRRAVDWFHRLMMGLMLLAILAAAIGVALGGSAVFAITMPLFAVSVGIFLLYELVSILNRMRKRAFPTKIEYQEIDPVSGQPVIKTINLEPRQLLPIWMEVLAFIAVVGFFSLSLIPSIGTLALSMILIGAAVIILIFYGFREFKNHRYSLKSRDLKDLEKGNADQEQAWVEEHQDVQEFLTDLSNKGYTYPDAHKNTLQSYVNRLTSNHPDYVQDTAARAAVVQEMKTYLDTMKSVLTKTAGTQFDPKAVGQEGFSFEAKAIIDAVGTSQIYEFLRELEELPQLDAGAILPLYSFRNGPIFTSVREQINDQMRQGQVRDVTARPDAKAVLKAMEVKVASWEDKSPRVVIKEINQEVYNLYYEQVKAHFERKGIAFPNSLKARGVHPNGKNNLANLIEALKTEQARLSQTNSSQALVIMKLLTSLEGDQDLKTLLDRRDQNLRQHLKVLQKMFFTEQTYENIARLRVVEPLLKGPVKSQLNFVMKNQLKSLGQSPSFNEFTSRMINWTRPDSSVREGLLNATTRSEWEVFNENSLDRAVENRTDSVDFMKNLGLMYSRLDYYVFEDVLKNINSQVVNVWAAQGRTDVLARKNLKFLEASIIQHSLDKQQRYHAWLLYRDLANKMKVVMPETIENEISVLGESFVKTNQQNGTLWKVLQAQVNQLIDQEEMVDLVVMRHRASDGVWEVAVAPHPEGYSGEIALPRVQKEDGNVESKARMNEKMWSFLGRDSTMSRTDAPFFVVFEGDLKDTRVEDGEGRVKVQARMVMLEGADVENSDYQNLQWHEVEDFMKNARVFGEQDVVVRQAMRMQKRKEELGYIASERDFYDRVVYQALEHLNPSNKKGFLLLENYNELMQSKSYSTKAIVEYLEKNHFSDARDQFLNEMIEVLANDGENISVETLQEILEEENVVLTSSSSGGTLEQAMGDVSLYRAWDPRAIVQQTEFQTLLAQWRVAGIHVNTDDLNKNSFQNQVKKTSSLKLHQVLNDLMLYIHRKEFHHPQELNAFIVFLGLGGVVGENGRLSLELDEKDLGSSTEMCQSVLANKMKEKNIDRYLSDDSYNVMTPRAANVQRQQSLSEKSLNESLDFGSREEEDSEDTRSVAASYYEEEPEMNEEDDIFTDPLALKREVGLDAKSVRERVGQPKATAAQNMATVTFATNGAPSVNFTRETPTHVQGAIKSVVEAVMRADTWRRQDLRPRMREDVIPGDLRQTMRNALGVSVDTKRKEFVLEALTPDSMVKRFPKGIQIRYDTNMGNSASYKREDDTLVIYINSTLTGDVANVQAVQAMVKKAMLHEMVETLLVQKLTLMGVWQDMSTAMRPWQTDSAAFSLKVEFEASVEAIAIQMMPAQELINLQEAYEEFVDLDLFEDMIREFSADWEHELIRPDQMRSNVTALGNLASAAKTETGQVQRTNDFTRTWMATAMAA